MRIERYRIAGMSNKLGLITEETDDSSLIQGLLDWMLEKQMDFTNTFRALGESATPPFADPSFAEWHVLWRQRLTRQNLTDEEVSNHMRAHNPAVIPRNHKVEEALSAAVENQDFEPMHRLLAVLTQPFHDQVAEEFTSPAPPTARPYQTFCGT